MKEIIKIGNKEFRFKKDALNYYQTILNSYKFGENISDKHYADIIELLNYDKTFSDNHYKVQERGGEIENENDNHIIENIRISKFNSSTKCFELLYKNGETEIISYRVRITKPKENLFSNFTKAARNAIQEDIRGVKNNYFQKHSIKGQVPCQETYILSKWTDLVVDHRQPNTLSVIIDRFLELNKINLKDIEYTTDENNLYQFKDNNLIINFRNYHKEKAVLRIVRKKCNSSRAYLGRIGELKNDLKIED